MPAPRIRSSASGSNSLAPSHTSSRSSKRSANTQEPDGSIIRSKRSKTNLESVEPAPHNQAMRQSASYALEMASHGPIRSHSISALIVNSEIEFIDYSHSIIISCEKIDFMQDHKRFLTMMIGLASLTSEEWGIHPMFHPPEILPPEPEKTEESGVVSYNQFDGYTLSLKTGDVLRLGNTLYRQHGLIGRGTCVIETHLDKKDERTTVKWSDKAKEKGYLIVKTSWPAKTRKPEREFLQRVYDLVNANKDHSWVLKHLPTLVHAEEVGIDPTQTRFKHFLPDKFELRELRISVQEKLTPIIVLTTYKEVWEAWRGIFFGE